MKLRRKLKHFLALLLVFVMTLSTWGGVGTVVHAAESETALVDKANTLKVDSVINFSDGKKQVYPWEDTNNPPVITYGDELHFSLEWTFANGDPVTTSDIFTYELPELVEFADVDKKTLRILTVRL